VERIPDASRQVAVPAEGVMADTDAHGHVVLRRRRYGSVRAALAKPFGVPPEFTIRLDALGSEAWGLLDGKRTVGEVHAELVRRRPGEADLAARLGKFLGAMASHKMIDLR
jgi:hypothetical protein